MEQPGLQFAQRHGNDILMGVFGTPLTTTVVEFDDAEEAEDLPTDKWYRLIATEDCHVLFSNDDDATTADMLMKAGLPEVFYLGGGLTRISVIKNATAGDLYITQLQTNPKP
jgi:hypothetical protein